eukprot:scaffold493992_cov17-Prasinocladus_malaysianus.AAC.1
MPALPRHQTRHQPAKDISGYLCSIKSYSVPQFNKALPTGLPKSRQLLLMWSIASTTVLNAMPRQPHYWPFGAY